MKLSLLLLFFFFFFFFCEYRNGINCFVVTLNTLLLLLTRSISRNCVKLKKMFKMNSGAVFTDFHFKKKTALLAVTLAVKGFFAFFDG